MPERKEGVVLPLPRQGGAEKDRPLGEAAVQGIKVASRGVVPSTGMMVPGTELEQRQEQEERGEPMQQGDLWPALSQEGPDGI